jgi:uncharacterized phage protein (TIGR02218 family)
MAFPLGAGELSTLRCMTHWHCDLYEIHRRDGGEPLRISTLDREVPYQGHTYKPTAGERSDEKSESGFASSDTELVGVIGPETITMVDLQRGVYNDAKIVQRIFDWSRGKRYRTNVWFVDEVVQDGLLWRAPLSSMARFLQQKKGDAYYAGCPAVFGDRRCRKVITTSSGTVTSVVDPQLEFGSGVSASTNAFALGFVRWLTGNNKGTLCRVHSFASGTFGLSTPTRYHIRDGDTFEATPGCDGRATTCKNVHNNLANFRGNERQGNARKLIVNRGSVS